MRMRLLVLLVLLASVPGCGAASDGVTPRAQRPAATPLLPTGPVVPDPRATVHVEPGQSVVLHHCGVVNIAYEEQEWEVENAPFDSGNAPDSFSGFGSFQRDGEVLRYTDDKGAALSFTLWDGRPDPYNCG